ncbi:MAG: hypothetical protein ACR2JI_02260 [Mycobacterium sp.]
MADIGLRLLDSLYEQLMIDDEWAVRRERGFTWWSFRLAQHIEVSEPEWSIDRYVCSVRIWTEVIRDVDPSTEPAKILGFINAYADLNAVVWDPAEATVIECCTAKVHEEIFGWLSKVLATAAVLQNAGAHTRAHDLADLIGGSPAASDHPLSGERPEMDDLLNLPAEVVVVEGAQPSRFRGASWTRVGDYLKRMGVVGAVDETGLTCEVPFTGREPALVGPGHEDLQTSLVQLFTEVPHPEMGNGLLGFMQLPIGADPDDVVEVTNRLNLLESTGEPVTNLLGAWCPKPNSPRTIASC